MAKKKGPKIPTASELRALPRWARVAFVARCARRVQPLFSHYWPSAPGSIGALLDAVIIGADWNAANAVQASNKALEAAYKVKTAVNEELNSYERGAAEAELDAARERDADFARVAAANARGLAFGAARLTRAADVAKVAYCATALAVHDTRQADRIAAGAIKSLIGSADILLKAALLEALRVDLERVKAATTEGNWTDGTPVSPGVFGPMWPNGEPDNWPSSDQLQPTNSIAPISCEEPYDQRLVISLFLPEFVDVDEASEKLVALIKAMSAYHVACGGSGLVIDDWQILAPAEEPTEVPV